MVRLVVAVICGIVIGFERKNRSKEAGIRTHAIVSMAAAMFMIVSKYLTSPDFGGAGTTGDPSRIAAQVVTGIGFLGSGIIMFRRDAMRGVTTAAGIWATSAIGMAIGAGFIVTGVFATLLILVLQFVFHLPIKAFATRHLATVKLRLWMETDDLVDRISAEFDNPKVSNYKAKYEGDKLIADVCIVTSGILSVKQIDEIFKKYQNNLVSIEQIEEV